VNNLYLLNAYQLPPLVRETRLIRDLTMPALDSRYEEPAYKRNPGYVARSRERHRRPVVKVLPFMLVRQAN
jgi:hypothetical protein